MVRQLIIIVTSVHICALLVIVSRSDSCYCKQKAPFPSHSFSLCQMHFSPLVSSHYLRSSFGFPSMSMQAIIITNPPPTSVSRILCIVLTSVLSLLSFLTTNTIASHATNLFLLLLSCRVNLTPFWSHF